MQTLENANFLVTEKDKKLLFSKGHDEIRIVESQSCANSTFFWVQIFRGFLPLCGKKSCKFPIKGAKIKEKVRSHADHKKRELIGDKKGEEFVLSKSHDEMRIVVSRSCAYSIFSSFFLCPDI